MDGKNKNADFEDFDAAIREWSKDVIDKYLVLIEKNFTDIVSQVYEDRFIDKIFSDFVATITREHFIMALTEKGGGMLGAMGDIDVNPFGDGFDKKGEGAWLFNPEEIREIFHEALQKIKDKLEEENPTKE